MGNSYLLVEFFLLWDTLNAKMLLVHFINHARAYAAGFLRPHDFKVTLAKD